MWESHTVAMTFIYCKCYIIGAYFCPVEVEATHPLLQHVLLPRPLTTSSSFPQFRCQRTTCIVTQALPPTPPPSWHHQVSEWHNVNVKWHDMKRSAYWFHVMLHEITVHYTQIATPPGLALRCHKSQHLPQRFELDHSSLNSSSPSLCPAIALEHSSSIAAAYISRKTPMCCSYHRACSPSYSPAGCWFRYDTRTFGQLQLTFILCKESV